MRHWKVASIPYDYKFAWDQQSDPSSGHIQNKPLTYQDTGLMCGLYCISYHNSSVGYSLTTGDNKLNHGLVNDFFD